MKLMDCKLYDTVEKTLTIPETDIPGPLCVDTQYLLARSYIGFVGETIKTYSSINEQFNINLIINDYKPIITFENYIDEWQVTLVFSTMKARDNFLAANFEERVTIYRELGIS